MKKTKRPGKVPTKTPTSSSTATLGSKIQFFVLGVLAGLSLLVAVARLTWHSKFYPGVRVAGISIAGLTREQAQEKINLATQQYQAKLSLGRADWLIPRGAVVFDVEATLNEAYRYGRRLSPADYLLLLVDKRVDYPLSLATGKTTQLESLISEIARSIEIPPTPSEIEILGKAITITNGKDGVLIDGGELDKAIRENYSELRGAEITIPIVEVRRALGTQALRELRRRAERLLPTSLTLVLDDEQVVLDGRKLISLLFTLDQAGVVDGERLRGYVEGLSESLNRPPQDAKFVFEGGEVKEFAPGKDGIDVRKEELENSIEAGIEKLLKEDSKNETVEIVVTRTPPQVTTGKVNELGISARIGRGESYYAHSIPNRIYNVGLAASRTHSALIAPGEEYSFNREVGEITGATGYKTAYVISGGRTVLGDGGGVCQVSTTLFRAAMNAGLPITERWAHAYRVGYYEQNSKPGIDATVYAPSKDLRFKNDTPGHILIQTINDPKTLHLVVEIYGTNDGRVASVSEPKVWGITPPPPDIYQDDPTLPAGAVKQVDWAAWGARTSFEYKVVRDGETLQEKTFTSAYRPWQNVYLRGTGQ